MSCAAPPTTVLRSTSASGAAPTNPPLPLAMLQLPDDPAVLVGLVGQVRARGHGLEDDLVHVLAEPRVVLTDPLVLRRLVGELRAGTGVGHEIPGPHQQPPGLVQPSDLGLVYVLHAGNRRSSSMAHRRNV